MTFSLVGRCERTGAVGSVIASASMAVAARCAAVRAGVGAVCSQSTTDPRLRGELLDAIAGGVPAGDALAALAGRTPDVAFRQLVVVDAAGGTASYSGERALGVATDVHAAGTAAAGNLLADTGVPAAMLAAFQDRAGDDLGDRLIAALRAGLAAGGEVSPVRSAGMLVAEAQPWPVTDLRVDWHDDPVGQLAGLWQLWQPQAESYVGRALRPSEMVQLCAASARAAAEPIDGPVQRRLAALAAATGLVLCAGTFPELDRGELFNTAVVYGPSGGLLLRHRKVHLYGTEPDAFRPGDSVTVGDIAGIGRVGLCVCFDGDFPETARALRAAGADLVLHPSAYEAAAERWWDVSRGNYDVEAFFDPSGGPNGRIGWIGIIAYLIGILVEVPFMSTTLWTGPAASAMNGTDLSWIVGLVITVPLYYLLATRFITRRAAATPAPARTI